MVAYLHLNFPDIPDGYSLSVTISRASPAPHTHCTPIDTDLSPHNQSRKGSD